MAVPQYTNACVPEQADVTINQTTVKADGLSGYWRVYSTADSSLTLDATRKIVVLPTTPISSGAINVYDNGQRLEPNMFSISGQVLTLTEAFPDSGHVLTVTFFSTTPGSVANAVQPGIEVEFPASLSVPDGWLRSDGSAVSRTTYAALFAVIGTTYGAGDASTTFNVHNQSGWITKT